jgi:hypothetical protein
LWSTIHSLGRRSREPRGRTRPARPCGHERRNERAVDRRRRRRLYRE